MDFLLLLELGLSLIDFIIQRNYNILKYKKIIIACDVDDIEQHIHRKEENKKYSIILVNKSCKNKLRRTKCKTKNDELKNIKKMIKDKELVNDQKQYNT